MFTFSDKEKELIKKAVEDLEKESSSEVVPYFTQQSDNYSQITWYVPSILSVIFALCITLMSFFWLLPAKISILNILGLQILLSVISFMVFKFIPQVRIFFVSNKLKLKRVSDRAKQVFLEEEVFNTRDRTGILIFVSYLERKVMVLGDSGINAKVKPEDWDNIVNHITKGIKEDKITNGIVAAIIDCKSLLLKNDFYIKQDDTNELPDDLRIN